MTLYINDYVHITSGMLTIATVDNESLTIYFAGPVNWSEGSNVSFLILRNTYAGTTSTICSSIEIGVSLNLMHCIYEKYVIDMTRLEC